MKVKVSVFSFSHFNFILSLKYVSIFLSQYKILDFFFLQRLFFKVLDTKPHIRKNPLKIKIKLFSKICSLRDIYPIQKFLKTLPSWKITVSCWALYMLQRTVRNTVIYVNGNTKIPHRLNKWALCQVSVINYIRLRLISEPPRSEPPILEHPISDWRNQSLILCWIQFWTNSNIRCPDLWHIFCQDLFRTFWTRFRWFGFARQVYFVSAVSTFRYVSQNFLDRPGYFPVHPCFCLFSSPCTCPFSCSTLWTWKYIHINTDTNTDPRHGLGYGQGHKHGHGHGYGRHVGTET